MLEKIIKQATTANMKNFVPYMNPSNIITSAYILYMELKETEIAYLIVDMNQTFANPETLILAEKIFTHITKHINQGKIQIHATIQTNPEDSPFTTRLNWLKAKTPEEQQLLPPLNKIPTLNIHYKTGYSAAPHLPLSQIKNSTVIIMGIDTDACIMATAFALFDQNINFHIAENYTTTTSRDRTLHNYALTIARRQFGKNSVITL